jgi:methylated-DNA-[protein]-cysteine S-methyltransferase
MAEYKATYHSEIGSLEIVGTETSITVIRFVESGESGSEPAPTNLSPVVAECLSQLEEYFRGKRQEFSVPLKPSGTEFQQAVWRELLHVPYGQTVSYLDIAQRLGNKKAIRAVGAANGQNPIVIIVPCHRVIGSNGQLTGYGGGLWRKAWLLNHEQQFSGQQLALF